MNNLNAVQLSPGKREEIGLVSIFDSDISLAILLELGKNKKIEFNKLVKLSGIEKEKTITALQFLERDGFIEQNPCNDDSKPFEKRVYRLKTKGLIFLQRIKEKFPEFKESFNFFF